MPSTLVTGSKSHRFHNIQGPVRFGREFLKFFMVQGFKGAPVWVEDGTSSHNISFSAEVVHVTASGKARHLPLESVCIQ